MKKVFLFLAALTAFVFEGFAQTAPAPLFRDPVTDGAADPVLIWNRQEKSWWMLYTQRRANLDTAGVSFCYGNAIGIASTEDNGRTWVYRGTLDLKIDKGHNTFWAPDIVYHKGKYHLFVAYIKGVRTSWGGQKHLVHFTSKDLWDWKYEGKLQLSSEDVIDSTIIKDENGVWRMWYKDITKGNITMLATSKDLKKWNVGDEPAIGGRAHEGAKVFKYGDYYWLLTDEWRGMRVYRSSDLENWEKQGLILDQPGKRRDDKPQGAHGDVVVFGDRAYIFYFTHPDREQHLRHPWNHEQDMADYKYRRSSLQVAPLYIKDGTLVAPRDEKFKFFMENLD